MVRKNRSYRDPQGYLDLTYALGTEKFKSESRNLVSKHKRKMDLSLQHKVQSWDGVFLFLREYLKISAHES